MANFERFQNEDFKSEATLNGQGGDKTNLLHDTKVYVTAMGINKTLDDAITDGDIGGGGSSDFNKILVDLAGNVMTSGGNVLVII